MKSFVVPFYPFLPSCFYSFTEILQRYKKKVGELDDKIAAILQEEWEERALQRAENQMNKMQNMLDKKEDTERPRVWFQTQKQRLAEKGAYFVNAVVKLFYSLRYLMCFI